MLVESCYCTPCHFGLFKAASGAVLKAGRIAVATGASFCLHTLVYVTWSTIVPPPNAKVTGSMNIELLTIRSPNLLWLDGLVMPAGHSGRRTGLLRHLEENR